LQRKEETSEGGLVGVQWDDEKGCLCPVLKCGSSLNEALGGKRNDISSKLAQGVERK